jgi:hypothetical protein
MSSHEQEKEVIETPELALDSSKAGRPNQIATLTDAKTSNAVVQEGEPAPEYIMGWRRHVLTLGYSVHQPLQRLIFVNEM